MLPECFRSEARLTTNTISYSKSLRICHVSCIKHSCEPPASDSFECAAWSRTRNSVSAVDIRYACESEICSNHVVPSSYSSTVADTRQSIHGLFMINVSDHVRLTRDVRGASWRYPGETWRRHPWHQSWTAIRHNLTTLRPAPHKRGVERREIRNAAQSAAPECGCLGIISPGCHASKGASTPDRE